MPVPLKQEPMTENFPCAVCTPALKLALVNYADAHGLSASAVVRHAVSIFLESEDAKTATIAQIGDKKKRKVKGDTK